MADNYGLPARYKNFELMGSGAIGSVYKVTDSQSGNLIALKYINSTERALAESLENEFSTLSRLSHPNLIRVHDYGRSETGHPYFTMDLIHGPHLKDHLKSQSEIAHSNDILMEILSALEYLSRRNIVHGDIKPENILIADEAGSVPILLDFGLSTLSRVDQNRIFGTPRFIAPEIFEARQYSPKSDIYALGHTFIECLADSTTPLSGDLSDDYFQEIYDKLNNIFSQAGISYARNLTSYILELSDPDLSRRPDSISLAMQKLSIISRPPFSDGIVIECSHISRKHIDDELSSFLQEVDYNNRLLILDGSVGSGKKSLLASAISQAQLLNYAVLNFIDVPSDGFSLQTLINILSINLSPSESDKLVKQHHKLLTNLKKAEATSDLDNLGVIYSNITEYVFKLSVNRPVLVVLPNIENLGSDVLKFLLHLINEIEFLKAKVKFALSYSSDIPRDDELNAQIEILSEKAITLNVQGLSLHELKVLCRDIFQDDLLTDDELNRVLALTNGIPQFILDYLNYLVINKVITRVDRTYFTDHKLLNKEYSTTKYNDIADNVLSRLSNDDIFFLNILSTYNAPVVLDIIDELLDINLEHVVESCDKNRLLELHVNSASLKSVFLRNSLNHHIDNDTQNSIHQILAKYTLLNNPEDYPRIADHFIKSGMIEEAFIFGMQAVEKLEESHEYYSAYGILLSLKGLIEKQDQENMIINVLEKIGSLELTLGYIDDSLRDYLTLIDMVGDSKSASRYYNKLGNIERHYKANASKAEEYYNYALDLARRHGDHEIESSTLTSMGSALNDVTYFISAAQIAKPNHPVQYVHAMSTALYFHTLAGNTEQCARINIELDHYLASDDSDIVSEIYDAKFINAFYCGDYDTANRMMQGLIAIAEQSCDERGHIRYMSSQAGIHYVQGHFNKQIENLRNAYNMIRKYQLYRDLLGVISNLALAYISIAKYSESVDLIMEGHESIKTYGISVIPLFYYSTSAHTFLFFGDHYKNEFEEQINKLEALAKHNRNKHSLGHKELISGKYQYFNMDFNKSTKHYSKALDIFQKINSKDDTLDALLKLSLTHRHMDDHENAREYAKRATKIFREINCGYLKPLYSFIIALTESHDEPGTLAPMLEAIDTSRAFGTRELTWQIQFHLAKHYKVAGDISNSVKYCRESINTLKEITESFDNSEQISSYLQVPLRQQVFDFVKNLKA